MSLFLDLYTSLQLEILAEWLGFPRNMVRVHRDMMRFDLAMGSKTMQERLKPLYESLNWSHYFSAPCYDRNPAPIIRWVTARKLIFSQLTLKEFTTDTSVLKEFIAVNGKTLKEIKMIDTSSGMAPVMKYIAAHCKVLETLWLENCNITLPLATVMNKCTTITELRVQQKGSSVRDWNDYEGSLAVRKGVFATVFCPGLTKLALRNSMDLSEVAAVIAAFPNVVELELGCCRGSVALTAMLQTWQHLEVLVIKHCETPDTINEVVCAALESSAPTLRKLGISGVYSQMNITALDRILPMCAALSEVSLSWGELVPGCVRAVAVHCNLRLQHLNIHPPGILNNQSALSLADVAAIAEHCPNIRTLAVARLTHCENYLLVLQNCTRIENLYLNLYNHTSAEYKAIVHNVAVHCKNLQRLNVLYSVEDENDCEFVDDLALIARTNRKLRVVGVHYKHVQQCRALLCDKMKVEVMRNYLCAEPIHAEFS